MTGENDLPLSEMQAIFAPILALNLVSYIPWTLVFLFTQGFGLRFYSLKRREECMRIQKRLQGSCSQTTDGGRGFGYSFGYWYAACISGEIDMITVHLIATEASYKALIKDLDEGDDNPVKENLLEISDYAGKIAIYERTGSFVSIWLRRRIREINDTPKPHQEAIISAIMQHQKKFRRTVVFLHGPPRTGKSMLGVLVANEYRGSFCNTLKPWQPGDTIAVLHCEVEPTRNKPIVLVFDEIDSVLKRIHTGLVENPKYPIAVTDKQGWNHMLDEIQRSMYQDIIIIMTSNVSPDVINALDTSYLAPHRVDLIFEMTETI